MRKNLILYVVLAVILASCQKEVDFTVPGSGGNGGGGGGGTTGNRLVKTVSKTATDSVVTVYTYNSNGKVINEKITGMDGGQDVSNEYRYYRNGSGIITRTVQINPSLAAQGIDSVINKVNHNGTRYTSDVSSLSLFGFTVNDSTVHVYDASGKVIRDEEYQEFAGVSPYELTLKIVYTYDVAGNVKQMDFYSHDASTSSDDLIGTLKYTFDSKTAAVNFGTDAIGLGRVDQVSVNNPIKAEFIDASDPANNFTLNFTFTYNSNNRPSTGTQTQTPGGATKNLSFFYQ